VLGILEVAVQFGEVRHILIVVFFEELEELSDVFAELQHFVVEG
jgi:hypothetical protein